MREENDLSDDITKGNYQNNIIEIKKINDNYSNNKYSKEGDYYENEIIPEKEKKSNEKKNIFVCKLIRSEVKKEMPIEKTRKRKKKIIKIEKCIAPPI